MRKETKALIESLRAMSGNVEPMAQALMLGRMTPSKQRAYADMLKELAELLYEHADLEEEGGTDG